MESSLHRQLKQVYADDAAQIEVPVGRYRVALELDSERGPVPLPPDGLPALDLSSGDVASTPASPVK